MGSKPELRLEDVRHERPGGFALGPISLKLGPGIWRITGGNGSGKTTMLRLLGGDLPPSSGRVVWNGLNLYRKEAARRDVSLLLTNPEQPDFFTVEEAWKLAAALRGQGKWDGKELQAELGLSGGQALGTLSTGMRRRAELLATLAGDPNLLLLDEVFAPLDAKAVAAVSQRLESWRERRLIFFTAHGDVPLRIDGEIFVNSWRQ